MQITCKRCGSDSFKAGYIEADPFGGFNVMMPCSKCNRPTAVMHAYDPETAQLLLGFFATPEEAS